MADQCNSLKRSGERGRNRTFNLLIKSYGSQCDCSAVNCSHHNNLTIKRPAWTASENVEKVGEIERYLIAKDTKRTQRDQHDRSEVHRQLPWFRSLPMPLVHVLCQNDQWLAREWDSNSR